ncbi:MAG: cyclic nucleotide-binding domain-containing protein [Nitrospira sp.]|nr:cyclic nucleotide-binding domain-containing protein [Nitrospira sp.]
MNQIPLLKILSAQDRRQVLGEMTEARYGKGQYIFREGDPTEYFHIVKEGSVKCVKSSPGGEGVHAEGADAGRSLLLRCVGLRWGVSSGNGAADGRRQRASDEERDLL